MKRLSLLLFSIVFIISTLEAQSTLVDFLVGKIDQFFIDSGVLILTIIGVTNALVQVIDQYTKFKWNKYTKILLSAAIWQLSLLLGLHFNLGFLADLSYEQAITMTMIHWAASSGFYTWLSTIPFIGKLFETKNQTGLK